MKAGWSSVVGTRSRTQRLATYVVGFAVAGAVVYALGLHGFGLRIVFLAVAVVVALLTSLVLNARRMTPQEVDALVKSQGESPMHDVKLGHHVEIRFGTEVHKKGHDE